MFARNRVKNTPVNEIPTSQENLNVEKTKGETKMAKEIQENEEVMTVEDPKTKKELKVVKPKRKLNPIVKWVLIGAGAAIVIGGVTYLIVRGKKVPVQAVEKTAEVVAEVAAAV